MSAITTLVGNLATEPELRYTGQGIPVCNCSIAVNRRTYNKTSNEWDSSLQGFFNLTIWREMAEFVAEHLAKGDHVIVIGDLQQQSYEDKEGETQYRIDVNVREIGPSLRFQGWDPAKRSRHSSSKAKKGSDPSIDIRKTLADEKATDSESAEVPF